MLGICSFYPLGEKIRVDSTFNSLVNEQGLANTNVEGDLKVEHQNLDLKLGLLNLAGNQSSKPDFLYNIQDIEPQYEILRKWCKINNLILKIFSTFHQICR